METSFYLHGDGSLATAEPTAGAEPCTFTFDPAHPVPTIGGLHCSIGELPAEGAGMEQAWARFLSPVLRLRDLLTPGPADQVESPSVFGSEEPYPRLSERPDVLVFQTEPLAEPIEVTGPMTVHLWISSSALDTDFTAKLIDVHPPNADYPDGYDMLLNDSVIRCRYREGFDREVLLEPGVPVPVTIALPPTSNLFAVGHRIRVDVSSSNWPRLDVNPNTGEPMGRHTHQVVAEQAVYVDAQRPSRIVLPVIPGEHGRCSGRSSSTRRMRRTSRTIPDKQQDVWNDLRDLRRLFRATPWKRGQTSLRHVPTLEQTLIDYSTRGAYDAWWARVECDYTRAFPRSRGYPDDVSVGLVRPVGRAGRRLLGGDDGAKQRLLSVSSLGPWSHVGMRGDATYCHEVDFGPDSVMGSRSLLRGAARLLLALACRTTRPGSPRARRRSGSS